MEAKVGQEMRVILTNLPFDIIYMILSHLDTSSVEQLYNTKNIYLRDFISTRGVVKKCDWSYNRMPAERLVGSSFLKDIGGHLVEINMRGVRKLDVSSLKSGFQSLKVIKTLDISHGNIGTEDLAQIYSKCPTIKDITVNFDLPTELCDNLIVQYQNLFNNFENVHFVGEFNVKRTHMAFLILKDAHIHNLQITDQLIPKTERREILAYIREAQKTPQLPVPFDYFHCHQIFTYNYGIATSVTATMARMLDWNQLEFIAIEYPIMTTGRNPFVLSSDIFIDYLMRQHNFDVENVTECPSYVKKYILMVWNNKTTQFNDSFYNNLNKQIEALKYQPEVPT